MNSVREPKHRPLLAGVSGAEFDARGAGWTAREIAQQPQLWLQIAQQIGAQNGRIEAFLAPLLARPELRIVLTGAGTSAFIGNCLAPALLQRLKVRTEAIATTDIVSGPAVWLVERRPTLLVSFARSGNSPESVAAVDLAEQSLAEVHHLIITCNQAGELARRATLLRSAELLVLPDATNDRSFAMTSSFSSMLLAAALLLGIASHDSVAGLCRIAAEVLERAGPLAQKLVERRFQRVVYLGSNELRGLAAEGALKLLELTDGACVAVAESTLGFRHGPKTIIDAQTLVVLMLSNNAYTRRYDLDLLKELRSDARAGAILALSGQAEGLFEGEHLIHRGAEAISDLELALLNILVAQTFALLQSLALGRSPDRPNASGVVNRVVQGVTIHPWTGARVCDVSRG